MPETVEVSPAPRECSPRVSPVPPQWSQLGLLTSGHVGTMPTAVVWCTLVYVCTTGHSWGILSVRVQPSTLSGVLPFLEVWAAPLPGLSLAAPALHSATLMNWGAHCALECSCRWPSSGKELWFAVKNVRSLISVSASASEECSEFAEQHTGLGTFLLPLRGHFRVVGKLWQCQNFLS